jgi:hypothetical protein
MQVWAALGTAGNWNVSLFGFGSKKRRAWFEERTGDALGRRNRVNDADERAASKDESAKTDRRTGKDGLVEYSVHTPCLCAPGTRFQQLFSDCFCLGGAVPLPPGG